MVRIDGSAGVIPLAAALAAELRAVDPGIAIEMGSGLGTKARIDALAQQRIDVALASHGVNADELATLGLVAHEIARSAVVFGVNASVPVSGLTSAQLCDIYSGAATSWSAFGGPDIVIAARARPAAEVDAEVVRTGIGCFGRAVGAGRAVVLDRPDEMAAALVGTAGAIGMTSMPFVTQSGSRIRALALDGVLPDAASLRSGRYPLRRASFLITHASPSPAVARFLAFVRGPAGARIITTNGGVPIE
jgi:phosphate transport system substrate-binding protein